MVWGSAKTVSAARAGLGGLCFRCAGKVPARLYVACRAQPGKQLSLEACEVLLYCNESDETNVGKLRMRHADFCILKQVLAFGGGRWSCLRMPTSCKTAQA